MSLTNPTLVSYSAFSTFANTNLTGLNITPDNIFLQYALDLADNNSTWVVGLLNSSTLEYSYIVYNMAMFYLILSNSSTILTKALYADSLQVSGLPTSASNGPTAVSYENPDYSKSSAFTSQFFKCAPYGQAYLGAIQGIFSWSWGY